jgi:Stress responsive A/B Barrel Domain
MSGFRHVVMFQWAEGTTTSQQDEVKAKLAELPAVIPAIGTLSLGTDAGVNPGNFDFVVVGDFAGKADYLAYRDHPAHRAVVDEYIKPILGARAAIQYEL